MFEKELPECIFYDFDGVMTDNQVLVDENCMEYVYVNRSDGYAISKMKELGIVQIIVSTETNSVVERRGEKLQIPVIHGINDKGKAINKYCEYHGYNPQNTIFIGQELAGKIFLRNRLQYPIKSCNMVL